MLSPALVALPRAGAPDLPPGGAVAVFTTGPSSTVGDRTSSAPWAVPAAPGERLESVAAPAGAAIALGEADDERMCAAVASRGRYLVPSSSGITSAARSRTPGEAPRLSRRRELGLEAEECESVLRCCARWLDEHIGPANESAETR